MIKKYFHQNWIFECPDAVMTSSILKCKDESYLIFGGHDKTLYLMDKDLTMLDDVSFDGWARCCYPIDLDGDGCEEILVGTGDGRLIALKFDEKKKKLFGIMNYKSFGMINCCAAGNLYQDENIELVFGGEEKTLKIFKNVSATEPVLTFYYDSWVTACALGYLKSSQFKEVIYCLVIGTKKGQLQVIHFKEGKPEILWQKQIYAQINDIKIGDVTNEGYNQIIVASDDSYVKIYDSEGKRISFIKIEEVETNKKSKDRKKLNRAKSLLIDDIDGDNANEIVVGSADGILRVYQNKSLNSKSFELKWRTSQSSGSIRGICTYLDEIKENKIKNIIFGGYGRTLRNVFDFEYGKKPVLKIPVRFKASKPPAKKVPKKAEKKEEIKVVPTSLRGFIKELINVHGFYLTLDLLINELMLKGYDRKEIEDELEFLKSQGAMIYDKIDVNVWSLVSEEIDELIEKNTKKAK